MDVRPIEEVVVVLLSVRPAEESASEDDTWPAALRWTTAMIHSLVKWVSKHGARAWASIAALVNRECDSSVTDEQCKAMWDELTAPRLFHPWSAEAAAMTPNPYVEDWFSIEDMWLERLLRYQIAALDVSPQPTTADIDWEGLADRLHARVSEDAELDGSTYGLTRSANDVWKRAVLVLDAQLHWLAPDQAPNNQ
ncbi:unnamed protein product [Pedinophyceae sp. YPF-701]|nr:unnamed protein product [Pedinophyceae sp. YPF-701]